MDSLLLVGACDAQFRKLLGRLGYKLVEASPDQAIPEIIRTELIDLIFVDASLESDALGLCEFFRSEAVARQIPLVCLTGSIEEHERIANARYPLLEALPPPHSIGSIASRIATLLRVRKIAGGEKGVEATMMEMNARLRDLTDHFEREMAEAKSIQESLLPASLPNDPRFTVAASYDPLEVVGGDWYSVHREYSGRITLQIADVSGHGLSSAFLGSMTKLAQSAAAQESPDRLLKSMNRLMTPILPGGKFITSAVASFDPRSGQLDFARAGHPPGLVFRRSTQNVEELKGEGFAIGFFEDSDYSLVQTILEPGDIFFLYTDGLPEGQSRNREPYGIERIAQAMKRLAADAAAADAIRFVLDDFNAFLDGRAVKDDVTVLALKRLSA